MRSAQARVRKMIQQGCTKFKLSVRTICALLALTFIIFYKFGSPSSRSLLNLPPVPALYGASWEQALDKPSLSLREKLTLLGDIIRTQLELLEVPSTSAHCRGRTLFCGSPHGSCGLGCQLHHKAACILFSYTMGVPLIHDATTGWPYKTPWELIFKRLGSNCSISDQTIFYKHNDLIPGILYSGNSWLCEQQLVNVSELCPSTNRYPNHLQYGLPLPKKMHEVLMVSSHENPTLWFIGQFIKFVVRTSDSMHEIIHRSKEQINFPEMSPVVGVHVRRTDKIQEAKDSRHDLAEYMNSVQEYFMTYFPRSPVLKTLYIASDDHKVLPSVHQSFMPRLNVIGLQSNATFKFPNERLSDYALKLIVQDMHFLAKCEHVVCGLSSNVCRLIYELLATRYTDMSRRLKSLDGEYSYFLWGYSIPLILLPVPDI